MAAGEVGVKGRRREREMAEENEGTTVKRRKLEEEVDVESRIVLSPCVQATNRGGNAARNSAGASETSVVIVRRRDSPVEEQYCQVQSYSEYGLLDRVSSVSCCSSNNKPEDTSKRKIEFVDIEEENGGYIDQTETSWIYDNLIKKRRDPEQEESVNMEIQEVESRRRLRMNKKEEKKKKKSCETVKEGELEGFFQAAEKDLRNKMLECSRKYNFDFERDEPLGGRYEWVKLNP